MKKLLKPNQLPFFTLAAGMIGLLVRLWLFSSGMDEKGLMIVTHPGAVLSWVLAALVIAALFICTRGLDFPQKRQPHAPPVPGCIGTLAAAIGIATAELPSLLALGDSFSLIASVLGIAAAACLCVMSYDNLKRKAPAFGLYLILIVYFLLHLVCLYRRWSWASQLQIYAFPLLASVLLMLACYHRTALPTSLGSWGSYLFFSQAAAFFCCLATLGTKSLFYPAMTVWMLLDPWAAGLPVLRKEAP